MPTSFIDIAHDYLYCTSLLGTTVFFIFSFYTMYVHSRSPSGGVIHSYGFFFLVMCSGKARKGDGNDLTPNPKKLHTIGKELDKLNRVINDMTPVSELPFNVRPHTRKEKNKLASR